MCTIILTEKGENNDDYGPGNYLLETGYGHGVTVSLIYEKLTDGKRAALAQPEIAAASSPDHLTSGATQPR